MELGTFGAILSFALDLEERARAFYEAGAAGGLAEAFRPLIRGSRMRHERLERARREGISEMILESISGLRSETYEQALDPLAAEQERLRQAIALEAATGRFYRDAAAKMPIREIVRLFERLAEESEARRTRLETGR